MPPLVPRSTLPRIVAFAVIAVAVLLVLRFVFAVAIGLLKWLALGAIVALVVWLVLSKDSSERSKNSSS